MEDKCVFLIFDLWYKTHFPFYISFSLSFPEYNEKKNTLHNGYRRWRETSKRIKFLDEFVYISVHVMLLRKQQN